MNSRLSLFFIFLRLGLTSFGGPVAHLGYFRSEFVNRRHWFTDEEYADNVALCQLIPGPASSQVGLLIGYQRAGYLGALLAWLGFTLPSALALAYLGITLANPSTLISPLLLTLLKAVALAVVLQAVVGMGKTFCQSSFHKGLMLASTLALMLIHAAWMTPLVILLAASLALRKAGDVAELRAANWRLSPTAIGWLSLFMGGLLLLPLVTLIENPFLEMLNSFFRAGALVFGGGHVVLPLLADATVNTGALSSEVFISGYGAAQAVPGPLFTFATFLGGALEGSFLSATIATLAIFTPAVALLFGLYPLWRQIKTNSAIRIAIAGANAAVVGVLFAALLNLGLQTLTSIYTGLAALIAYLLLEWLKVPAWILVATAATISIAANLV